MDPYFIVINKCLLKLRLFGDTPSSNAYWDEYSTHRKYIMLSSIINSRTYVSITTSQRVLASDRAREWYLVSAYRLILLKVQSTFFTVHFVLHSAD